MGMEMEMMKVGICGCKGMEMEMVGTYGCKVMEMEMVGSCTHKEMAMVKVFEMEDEVEINRSVVVVGRCKGILVGVCGCKGKEKEMMACECKGMGKVWEFVVMEKVMVGICRCRVMEKVQSVEEVMELVVVVGMCRCKLVAVCEY
jgi:hypothetical protein